MVPHVTANTNTHDVTVEKDSTNAVNATEIVPIVNRVEDRAKELFNLGKRHYYCHNYGQAVNSFSESSEILSELYGDLDYRCAEVYFYYGRSLVEQERLTQQLINVIDKQKDQTNEDSSDESSEDDEEDEPEDSGRTIEATEPNDEPDKCLESQKESVTVVDSSTTDSANGVKSSTSSAVCKDESKDVPSSSVNQLIDTPDEDQTGPESVISDAMAAWEVLDTARLIFERHLDELSTLQTPESRQQMQYDTLRLVDIRMSLGELCVLEEKYDDGIQEFTYARHLLQSVSEPDDRRVAETYFQIGLAHECSKQFSLAIENMNSALDLLRTCQSKAQRALQRHEDSKDKGSSPTESDAERSKLETEVKDLGDVLAQMEQRLADLFEATKTVADVTRDLNELKAVPTHAKQHPVDQLPSTAADVSHLVRKPLKRTSPPAENGSRDVKRVKIETPIEIDSKKNAVDASAENDKKENGTAH